MSFIDFSFIIISLSALLSLKLGWKQYSKEFFQGSCFEKHYIYLAFIVCALFIYVSSNFFDFQDQMTLFLISYGLFFMELDSVNNKNNKIQGVNSRIMLKPLLSPLLNMMTGLLIILTILGFWFFKYPVYSNLIFMLHILSRGVLWSWKIYTRQNGYNPMK